MMEQRKALTIPFAVDKDNQVSWTAFSGCKFRHRKAEHKNGSVMFDRKLAAMIQMEMDRRKPRLVLQDVLKTESGMAYLERKRKSDTTSGREQMTGTQRESGRLREEPLTPRDTRSCQKEARNKRNNTVTPKCSQSTSPASSQRSRLRRRLHKADDKEDKDEHRDIEKVIIGKDNGDDDKFAEVVDCGLSVSWEPTEVTPGCDDFSPASIKDRWSDPEKAVQHSLKRKMKDSETQCNGTGSPKRHRESVLRLTGEDRRDGGPVPTSVSTEEECGDDGDLENQDNLIVQFTVGEDDRTEILVPVISNNLEAGNSSGSPRQSLSFSQENTTITTPSEPIVLSSDEEESGDVPRRRSQGVRTLATVKETVIQKRLSQEAAAKRQEASHIQDMQVLQVVVAEGPSLVAASPEADLDYSCMTVAFSSLHSGGCHGKANGGIVIANQKIIIPLTDPSGQVKVTLNFERKDLQRYSIWEQCELEAQELHFTDNQGNFPDNQGNFPTAFLLFCMSENCTAAIQRDLCQLGVTQEEAKNTGKASPFILLTLTEPLEGVEGAVLRSLLDIFCLNSLSHEQSTVTHGADRVSGLDGIHSPVLSLEDSIELIRRTGRDSHLLSMLGVRSSDPELSSAQDSSHPDSSDKSPTAHIQLEVNLQKEPVLETETPPEREEPKEDQKEQNIQQAPEKKEEEHTPVYTLCHRRTKATYSVSLCKPDASWTKYKHQGLAHRLIQFPPPPLKGGITVTMEDLQCLDNGQFLNDVIIDFYLKYLLQNASAAVAERTHIFSSFFYKQLTRRDNASEGANSDSCQRQRRHQRVKTWTRHVDIFKKDFLFVPVNQEAHWYLVVICFPGLDEPKLEDWTGPNSQTGTSHSETGESQGQHKERARKSSNGNVETPPTLAAVHRSDSVDTGTENAKEEPTKEPPPGPVKCSEQTCQKQTVCKRPCILIMDSLKLSLHERVFKLLREYLQSEWEVRRGSSREFGPDQMKNSHCKVPLQDNSSDCGLYLLQYVECFLKDPVVHFDLPLRLERWFPRQLVRRKRDEIRDLILNLYRRQNLDNRHTKEFFC